MQSVKFKRRYYTKKNKRGTRYGRVVPPLILNLQHEVIVARCDFCLLGSSTNKNGEPEELLVCYDCGAKAHPTCMDYGPELAARSRLSPWQCINCKTCTVCGDAGNADAMLFCDFCDKGYHMNCHSPAVNEKPTGKWACQICHDELVAYPEIEITQIIEESFPEISNCQDGDDFLNSYPDVIPDASRWTINDVEMFITKIGFPKQAYAFRDQEIDGKSLLLMKRNDVLTGLSIHLGPALKIYNHVQKLQRYFSTHGMQINDKST